MSNLREKKQELVRNLNRSAIFDAAVGLFKEYGFDGFTMQQVAERAGMAIGTLYNNFTSKEQIIEDVGDSLFEEFWGLTKEAIKQGTAIEKLERFSICFLQVGVENRELIKLFRQDKFNNNCKQKLTRLLELLQNVIETGIAENEFQRIDSKTSAFYILSFLAGYNLHAADIQEINPQNDAKSIINFLKPSLTGHK